jgi:hypothetical protein
MSDIGEMRNAAVATLEAAINQVQKVAGTADLVAALKDAGTALEATREALLDAADAPKMFWDVDVLE